MKKFISKIEDIMFYILEWFYCIFVAEEDELKLEYEESLINIIVFLRIFSHVLFVVLISIITALIACNN